MPAIPPAPCLVHNASGCCGHKDITLWTWLLICMHVAASAAPSSRQHPLQPIHKRWRGAYCPCLLPSLLLLSQLKMLLLLPLLLLLLLPLGCCRCSSVIHCAGATARLQPIHCDLASMTQRSSCYRKPLLLPVAAVLACAHHLTLRHCLLLLQLFLASCAAQLSACCTTIVVPWSYATLLLLQGALVVGISFNSVTTPGPILPFSQAADRK